MKWGEFRELEDCDQCPLKKAEICSAKYTGMDMPCVFFDDDTDLDKYVTKHFEDERRYEEREDKRTREKAAQDAKNKHAQELRNQSKRHVWSEMQEIKRRQKMIAANERILNYASSYANAVNFANQAFGYSERVEPAAKNPLESENERLRQEIAEFETVKKRKLKELRESRKAAL